MKTIREETIRVDDSNEIELLLFKERSYYVVLGIEWVEATSYHVSGRGSVKIHKIFADQATAEEFYKKALEEWK